MSERRKSLIPKPSINSLKSSISSKSTTPTHSPSKSLRSQNSPTKLPLSNSNSSINSLLSSRKRSITNSFDDYLSNLQSHLSNDLETEKSSLSNLLLELDSKLSIYYKLSSKLKDLQKLETKLNNSIFEYEIGIPVKNSILEKENLNSQNEIENRKLILKAEKENYIKKINHKKEKLINILNNLYNDAKIDDNETLNLRNKRLENLNLEKENLLKKIETAKLEMDINLLDFEKKFQIEKSSIELQFKELEDNLSLNLQNLQNNLNDLNNEKNSLESEFISNSKLLDSLNSDILLKSNQINESNFKLSDIKSLIEDLKLDLNNAQSLCSNFENGEYNIIKQKWLDTKSRLLNEKRKRLKIEIQIRELSGIPNIIILNNKNNNTNNNQKLNEFLKPEDYDWKSELFTSLESSLEGISSYVIYFSNLNSHLTVEIENYLYDTFNSNNRFENFNLNIKKLNNLNSFDSLENLKLSNNIIPILVEMKNEKTLNIKKSLILINHIKENDNNLDNSQIKELSKNFQLLTIVENISNDSCIKNLIYLSSLKPIKLRQSYYFLNK